MSAIAEVIQAGQRSLIVAPADETRSDYGLSPGGPFDEGAASAANRAVGNPSDAAVLECAVVGPELRFLEDALIALCGADGEVKQLAPRAGESIAFGRITGGARLTAAIRGGLLTAASRFDLLPHSLVRGEAIFSGQCSSARPRIATSRREMRTTIAALAGPHLASSELLAFLRARRWRVTNRIDRAGIRLACDASVPSLPASLPSCGMQFGTVQWHPGGELVAMGPDHPVTGGYLQVMTILSTERWKLAHLQPGEEVQFSITDVRTSS